jgi:hypothetical protein
LKADKWFNIPLRLDERTTRYWLLVTRNRIKTVSGSGPRNATLRKKPQARGTRVEERKSQKYFSFDVSLSG